MKQISQNNLQTPGAQVAALQAIIKAQQQQLDVYQRLLERKSKGKPKAVIVGKFKITSQEILKMPTVSKTKNEFAVHDIIIRCRQLPGGMLQARMNRKGIVLDVKGRTPLELRTRFVKAFEDALAQQAIDDAMVASPDNSPTFMEYAYKWLAIKKRTTKPSTYKEYYRQVDNVESCKFAQKRLFNGQNLAKIESSSSRVAITLLPNPCQIAFLSYENYIKMPILGEKSTVVFHLI